jgi:hypothetical protein
MNSTASGRIVKGNGALARSSSTLHLDVQNLGDEMGDVGVDGSGLQERGEHAKGLGEPRRHTQCLVDQMRLVQRKHGRQALRHIVHGDAVARRP